MGLGGIDLRARAAFLFGVVLLLGFYLYRIFSHLPFLQQEMLGQLVFWTQRPESFFRLLFDPSITDAHPGRFRYVEYVTEALYWNLFQKHWLPFDLYDYFAIGICLWTSYLLNGVAKVKGLGPIQRLLCLSLFLLSAQVFMVNVYHFRKAKTLAIFLLVLLMRLLQRDPLPKRWIVVVTLLGVLTDPFFILLSPWLVVCRSADPNYLSSLKSYACGLFSGALSVILLNGVIGPLFHPNCRLVLFDIPVKPESILNVNNLLHAWEILPDIFGSGSENLLLSIATTVAALSFVFVFLYVLVLSERRLNGILFFLLALPTSAFLLRPSAHLSMYGGYYGLPMMFCLTVACIETFTLLKERRILNRFFAGICLLVILLHHFSKEVAFHRWQAHHFQSPLTQAKFYQDYRDLRSIWGTLSEGRPAQVRLDFSHAPQFLYDSIYEQGETGRERERTLLAYVGFPVLFSKQISEGKLRVITE